MNIETSNGNGDTGHERKQATSTLDKAALQRWLTTEVDVTVPMWAVVATGFGAILLLLAALD